MRRKSYRRDSLRKRLLAMLLAVACVVTLLPQGSLTAEAATGAVATGSSVVASGKGETTDAATAEETYIAAPKLVTTGDGNTLWANGSTYSDNDSLDAIKWHYDSKDERYYLYLPSSADLDHLVLWHTFSGKAYVNGKEIVSGYATDVFAGGGKFTVQVGSTSYKLTVMHSTNINTMFITTKSGSLDKVNASKDNKDSGSVVYVDAKGKAAEVELEQIKGRGNSSWEAAQKLFYKYPYNLKFASKVKLFGMSKSKKWCLLANDFDQSLIRNKFVFDLAEDAGMKYTPECEFADVYQNGRYIGNYLVTSKVEVDGNRVDIYDLEGETEKVNTADLDSYSAGYSSGSNAGSTSAGSYKYVNIPNDPEDITGGYLLEFDLDERYPGEVSGFVSSKKQPVVLKSPEFASKNQVKYIRDYFQQWEDAVYSGNGYNSNGTYYADYIDLESAAQMYIIEELTMDNDAVATSFYLYKDTNDIFHFGPVWDFDWALGGYANYSFLKDTSKLMLTQKKIYSKSGSNNNINIMGVMYNNYEDFREEVKRVWEEQFAPLLEVSVGNKEAYTDNVQKLTDYGNLIEDSANMNFKRHKFLGTTYWGSAYTGSTFTDNVNYVNSFVKTRYQALNKIFTGKVKKTDLYFDNSMANWSNVYAYVWNNTTDGTVINGTLVNAEKKIYKFSVPDTYANVIFKNTSSTWDKQTKDLVIPTNGQNAYLLYGSASKSNGAWFLYDAEPVNTDSPAPATPTPTPVGQSNVLYFNNSATKWSNVYAYVWNNTTDAKVFAGQKVSGTSDMYKITLSGSYKNVLFKNTETGWDRQTTDQVIPTNGNNSFVPGNTSGKVSGSWSTYIEVTVAPTATPVVTPTVEPTATPVAETAVYFDNSNAKWSNVYAYVWANGVASVVLDMTEVETNIYKVSVPNQYTKILFKNTKTGWDKQTGDFLVPVAGADNCWKPNGSYNKASGSWYAYAQNLSVTLSLSGQKGNVTAKAYVTNGTAPFTYTFADTKDGVAQGSPQSITTSDLFAYHTLSAYYGATYGSTVTVTDVEGNTATATAFIEIGSLEIESITPDVTPGVVGQTVNFTAKAINEFYYKFQGHSTWEIKDMLGNVVSDTNSFTPVAAGTYSVTYTLTDASGETASKTISYVVKEQNANIANVYYSTGWTTAYIHFKVGNGAWTSVPGIQMTASDKAGYTWMYTIDLDEAANATVCFNNGNGNWDSKNGSNYVVGEGDYAVKNGVVYKISE